MNTEQLIEIPEVNVSEKGIVVASTLEIAKFFDKRHDNVLRDIENLQKELPKDFYLLNFEERNYIDERGKTYPMYILTRDGFSLLAMGFTGAKALQFKVRYIEAFNKMEAELINQKQEVQQPVIEKTPKQALFDSSRFKRIDANFYNSSNESYFSEEWFKGIRGLLSYQAHLNNSSLEKTEESLCELLNINSLEKAKYKHMHLISWFLWNRMFNVKDESTSTQNTAEDTHLLEGLIDALALVERDPKKILESLSNVSDIRRIEKKDIRKVELGILFTILDSIVLTSKLKEINAY